VGGLAVLPFRNLSGDASQDYFADGLTEGLIADLGRIGGLRVVSRTTAMRYRGTTKALPDVARELGVEALVEGSVVRESGRVRVTAGLFQADDRQIWTESYERTLREILVLQRDIVRAVSTRVRATLALPEETRMSVVRSVDPDVYEAYLKGRYYWNKRTHESLLEAVEQYEFATGKDPTYAPAYVGLADCFNQLGTVMVGVASPGQMRPRARAAALAALQIDDGLGEAHAALAYVHHYNWEWAAAGREFDRAVELAPNYALAHLWRANYLASLNRLDEALVSVRRAFDLDPMSPVVNTNVGWTLAFAGRHREAADAYRAALALDPKYVQAHMRLSSAYLLLGRADDALAEARTVVELMGENASSLGALAAVYAGTGRSREAEQVLQRILAMQNRHFVSPWGLAGLYLSLGRYEEGFAALEQAYEERSNGMAYLAVTHNELHNDPRYRRLLQRVGVEAAAAAPGLPATAANRKSR
jgi:TolB-like protein/tetratricopeptide (TPR) repeat protein